MEISAVRNIKTDNALEDILFKRFVDELEVWVLAAKKFGKRSLEAKTARIKTENQEWFFKHQCSLSSICTTTIKRNLNLFPY